jgi:hypothetical protein
MLLKKKQLSPMLEEMVRKKLNFLLANTLLFLISLPLEARSFDEIFPNLTESRRNEVFSEGGAIRSVNKGEGLEFLPAPSSGVDLPNRILAKNPAYLAESLLVVPYTGRPLTVLDAYNALGKVQSLSGRLYRSHTRNQEVPLFEDATRLESAKRINPIPDPPPAPVLPSGETVYLRLKDTNFGNSYYQADISFSSSALLYSLSNFRSISYLFFTVMKEEKFSALLYLEPLEEGMLVYSIAGTDVSDFIAGKINIPSAIAKRLAVVVDWVSDGIREMR